MMNTLTIRQVGCVAKLKSAIGVYWGMREKVEWIQRTRWPKGLPVMSVGQWFEAMIERTDDCYCSVVRVLNVKEIDPILPMTDAEAKEFWDSLPIVALPVSNIDLTKLGE